MDHGGHIFSLPGLQADFLDTGLHDWGWNLQLGRYKLPGGDARHL
jgi:hypothetical protein